MSKFEDQPPAKPCPPRASIDRDTIEIIDGKIAGERLFKNRGQVSIDHNGQTYRLSVTSMGKLLLTK